MNEIREAILAAADQIDRRPHTFVFCEASVPVSEYACGCALGWIGYFLNQGFGGRRLCNFEEVAIYMWKSRTPAWEQWLLDRNWNSLTHYGELYAVINENSEDDPTELWMENWRGNPDMCVKGLRALADKFWPEVEPLPVPTETMPTEVRALFDETKFKEIFDVRRERQQAGTSTRGRVSGDRREGGDGTRVQRREALNTGT